jgi:hypothetical protein
LKEPTFTWLLIYVDVLERHVGDKSDGAAVVHELANVGAAVAHQGEPDHGEWTGTAFEQLGNRE